MSKSIWFAAILFSMLFLMACSGSTDDDEVASVLITEILDDIEELYNLHDVDGIMAYFHPDFLHYGDNRTSERYTWEIRMTLYPTMEIDDIEVEKDGLEAVASFTMTLIDGNDIEVYNEPDDHGDFSYFYKDVSDWKIYGNQQYGSGIGYQMSINTDPQGALIYFDDASVYQYTPAILQSIPGGVHTVRLYKYGYNEYEETITVPDTYQYEITLSEPGYPKPEFDLDSPLNGYSYASTTVSLEGLLWNRLQSGSLGSFDGTEYTMTFNGQETTIGTNGVLIELLAIQSGQNELQLRATNASGNTGWSNTIIFEGLF